MFSYACPACNQFQPYMRKLEHSVPANVVIDFVPASFNPAEDWPMFQLAYVTAQTLGIADKTHDAMFDAVWTTRRARHDRSLDQQRPEVAYADHRGRGALL